MSISGLVRRRGAQFAAAVAAFAAVLGASTALATPAFASPSSDLAAATNASRAAHGLPALQRSADLDAIAQAWANHLAATNVLAHNGALQNQVANWTVLGENVGRAGDIPSVQQAFMNSPEHRANILDSRFTQIGVGAAVSTFPSCGCQQLWVVVDFRRPETTAAAPKPPAPPAPPASAPKQPAPQAPKAGAPKPAATSPATHKPADTAAQQPVSAAARSTATTPGTASQRGSGGGPAAQESPSASASATALVTQVAAVASTPASGASASDPVSRVLNFASLVGSQAG